MIYRNALNAFEDIVLNLALMEDLGFPWRDVTTNLLFANGKRNYQATIISKHPTPIVICGIYLMRQLFAKLSDQCEIKTEYEDGDYLEPGKTLLTITATPQILLKGERVALNFLRHLCAVATLTAEYVKRVKKTKLKILDTRKTTPGLRHLEKYAVYCGGGANHRMGLYDAIMIKDTHVDILGGMEQAIDALPTITTHGLPVIVEVRSPQELAIVLKKSSGKVSRVLLDNMSLEVLHECVRMCDGQIETEASGGVCLKTILEIAKTGVDYASVGELTYNAGHVDLSMYTSQV